MIPNGVKEHPELSTKTGIQDRPIHQQSQGLIEMLLLIASIDFSAFSPFFLEGFVIEYEN